MPATTACPIELVGHATLLVRSGGRALLTDPWLVDPMGCGSGFHFPPLVHDAEAVAAETDAIYISHIHPDHFHPPSLELFAKTTPIYIGDYTRKDFRDAVAELGFPVLEVPFQTLAPVEGTPFRIAIVEHDYDESAAYDSSLVVETPEYTLFENNDCFLSDEKYRWVASAFDVDFAFLGYSAASFFPICFEMPEDEKQRLLDEAAERRYRDFVHAAELLAPRVAVPFASGARFLLASALWKNVSFNSPVEALRRLDGCGARGAILNPGDGLRLDGSVDRHAPILEQEDELPALESYARSVQPWVERVQREAAVPQPGLVDRFAEHVLGLWRSVGPQVPGVADTVIAYVLTGDEEERFYFDFTAADGRVFRRGEPERYDMRYTYPAGGLQLVLDGEIDWDQLHFTDAVSVHQVRYARDFYKMLRSDMLDLERAS